MARIFAACSPGLEPVLTQELYQLGLVKAVPGKTIPTPGGVAFEGEQDAIYRSNLWLRSANRVLVRLGDFYAAAFSELRKKASRLEWEHYLVPGNPITINVTCRKSRLYHSDAVAERVAGAINDRLGQTVPIMKPDESGETQLILVRLFRDHCTISIDSSGARLHRRGYRLAGAKAPLRETLAAGILLACDWEPTAPLIDPFCGSGTIAIEAALLARQIPPGSNRRFAFMDWPNFDPINWQKLQAESKRHERCQKLHIFASDRDAGAIQIAKTNAERVGVTQDIEFSQRALSAIEPQGTGWVVTNPPYGRRVSANKDLRNLYAQIGNVLRAKCPAWQVAILSGDKHLLNQTGLKLDTSLSVDNGGIPVMLGQGIVPK